MHIVSIIKNSSFINIDVVECIEWAVAVVDDGIGEVGEVLSVFEEEEVIVVVIVVEEMDGWCEVVVVLVENEVWDRLAFTSGNVSTQNRTIETDMIITDMMATIRA